MLLIVMLFTGSVASMAIRQRSRTSGSRNASG
jgi:hypothetical protein